MGTSVSRGGSVERADDRFSTVSLQLDRPERLPRHPAVGPIGFRTKPLEQHPAERAMSAAEEPLQRAISGISGRFRRSDDLGRTSWTASGIIGNLILVSHLRGP